MSLIKEFHTINIPLKAKAHPETLIVEMNAGEHIQPPYQHKRKLKYNTDTTSDPSNI